LSILQIWFSLPRAPVGLATPEAIERLNCVFRSLDPDGYKSAGPTHGLIWAPYHRAASVNRSCPFRSSATTLKEQDQDQAG
jgi:hypothetical protein